MLNKELEFVALEEKPEGGPRYSLPGLPGTFLLAAQWEVESVISVRFHNSTAASLGSH